MANQNSWPWTRASSWAPASAATEAFPNLSHVVPVSVIVQAASTEKVRASPLAFREKTVVEPLG